MRDRGRGTLGRGTVFTTVVRSLHRRGDADLRLQSIYGKGAELSRVLRVERYGAKPWTRAEHKAIRALQMQLSESNNQRDALRILPLRVGDGDVDGITVNTIAPDARQKPVAQTAELIVNRLRLIVGDLDPGAAAPPLSVYLGGAARHDRSEPCAKAKSLGTAVHIGATAMASITAVVTLLNRLTPAFGGFLSFRIRYIALSLILLALVGVAVGVLLASHRCPSQLGDFVITHRTYSFRDRLFAGLLAVVSAAALLIASSDLRYWRGEASKGDPTPMVNQRLMCRLML